MKIFKAEQIRKIDSATIELEPVSSEDLMERAATAVSRWIAEKYNSSHLLMIFAGPGNNGGDALAVARLLMVKGYQVRVFILSTGAPFSHDMQINLNRLKSTPLTPEIISSPAELPAIIKGAIIIDGIFGSGLSRPPSGLFAETIKRINLSGETVISIDIPSGLYCDDVPISQCDEIISATYTLSFQFPKLSFMTEEGNYYTGKWEILDIGLLPEIIEKEPAQYYYITKSNVTRLLKPRGRFDHKGVFGHALIVAGSYGKAGAAILASHSALRTGAGLVTCHLPAECISAIQSSLPEVMANPDEGEEHIITPPDMSKYDAVGIGPGIGTDPDTRKAFAGMITSFRKPLVLDADALNILSLEPEMLSLLPENSVLTPHPGEFRRLTGVKSYGFDRIKLQKEFAARHKCIVVLKGANTSIALPDGRLFFNSTGNPGMATAGSGDVLTGIITSLMAQGFLPADAAITGVYLHGLAGDQALEENSPESLIAGDIIRNIGRAYKVLYEL